MSLPVFLATLVHAVSAAALSNLTIMKVNTPEVIIQIIAQLVYKISVPITEKLKLNDTQPLLCVIGVNARFMGRPASRNVSVDLTKENPWTP